jgi:hypothetical protein
MPYVTVTKIIVFAPPFIVYATLVEFFYDDT